MTLLPKTLNHLTVATCGKGSWHQCRLQYILYLSILCGCEDRRKNKEMREIRWGEGLLILIVIWAEFFDVLSRSYWLCGPLPRSSFRVVDKGLPLTPHFPFTLPLVKNSYFAGEIRTQLSALCRSRSSPGNNWITQIAKLRRV